MILWGTPEVTLSLKVVIFVFERWDDKPRAARASQWVGYSRQEKANRKLPYPLDSPNLSCHVYAQDNDTSSFKIRQIRQDQPPHIPYPGSRTMYAAASKRAEA